MDVNNSISSAGKRPYSAKELFLSLLLFAVGFLYWELIGAGSLGAAVTVFTVIVTLVTAVYMRLSGFRQRRQSVMCNVLIYISALSFIIFDSSTEKVLNLLWLMFLFIYWVALFAGRTLGNNISVYTIGDWSRQIIITPFANFASIFAILVYGHKDVKNKRQIISGCIGIIVFLPLLLLVIMLLSSADSTFAGIFGGLFSIRFSRVMFYLQEFLFGIPVAMYLCGLIIGNSFNNHAECRKEHMDDIGKKASFAPNAAINTVLSAFCLIYIIFFAAQLWSLINSADGSLPENMTYAQYARKGFFQLCFVAGINLGVCAAAYAFVKNKVSAVFRGLVSSLSCATILIGITVMSKMLLYIKYYGLTQLRVYVSWFIIMLILIFAVIFVRQIKKFNATRIIAVVFTVCFMVLSFGNVNGQIAKYNIERYEAGTLEMMDEETLYSLSYAAVPYIVKAYDDIDDAPKREALLKDMKLDYSLVSQEYDNNSWKGFNLQEYKGEKLQREFLAQAEDEGRQ